MSDSATATTVVLYIKHIVCPRGMRVVRQELEGLGLRVLAVRLGAATVAVPPGEVLDWGRLRAVLGAAHFALVENPSRDFVSGVQNKVAELLGRQPAPRLRAFMAVLAQELNLRPAHLNATFASQRLGSLGAYIGNKRLVRAQELLLSPELSIGHVARCLGYGSLAHFSGQFRRATHCSPSTYRRQGLHPGPMPPPVLPNDVSPPARDAKPILGDGSKPA